MNTELGCLPMPEKAKKIPSQNPKPKTEVSVMSEKEERKEERFVILRSPDDFEKIQNDGWKLCRQWLKTERDLILGSHLFLVYK